MWRSKQKFYIKQRLELLYTVLTDARPAGVAFVCDCFSASSPAGPGSGAKTALGGLLGCKPVRIPLKTQQMNIKPITASRTVKSKRRV